MLQENRSVIFQFRCKSCQSFVQQAWCSAAIRFGHLTNHCTDCLPWGQRLLKEVLYCMLMGWLLKHNSQAPAHTPYLTIGLHSVVLTSGMPVLYSRHGLAMSWTPSFVYLHQLAATQSWFWRMPNIAKQQSFALKYRFGMDVLVNQGAACCSASGSSKMQLIYTISKVNST